MTDPTATVSLTEEFLPVFTEIGRGAIAREAQHELPREAVERLSRAGFTALRVPEAFDGRGVSIAEFLELLELLASFDSNVAHALREHIAFVEKLLNAPAGAWRDGWLRRIAGGTIVASAISEVNTTAGAINTVLADDGKGGLTLSGTKYYTTGSLYADYLHAFVRRENSEQIVSVLVDARDSRVEILDDWYGFGQTLTSSGSATFREAPVDPVDVHPVEEDYDNFLYLDASYQLILQVVQAGIIRGALTELSRLVGERTRQYSLGNGVPSRDDPQILQLVGEVSAKAYTAHVLVKDLAAQQDALFLESRDGSAEKARALAESLQLAVSRSQVVLTRLLLEASTQLFDALGASALARELSLDRFWRNSRTIASHNPWIYKARIVGDWEVNRTPPPYFWLVQ